MLLTVQALALLGVVLGAGPLATASVLLFGAANGMMTLERAAVLVEWYGPTTFGTRQGRLSSATGVARAVSPFIVEAGHHVASYRVVFGILALTFCRWRLRLRGRRACALRRAGPGLSAESGAARLPSPRTRPARAIIRRIPRNEVRP